MLTPAQRHRVRVLQQKAQAQAAADPFGEVTGDAYQLMLAKLAADRRRLSDIQSVTHKREVKATLLPDYLDWIGTALQTGTGAQDQVLASCMVWAIDAGAYALALDIAAYVLAHGLTLPDQFQRTPAVVVVDELSNAYLRGQWTPLDVGADAAGRPVLLDRSAGEAAEDRLATSARLLTRALDLTAAFDAPDPARAKLHKAIAYATLGKVQTAEDPDLGTLGIDRLATAREHLQSAFRLDSASGVKKDIERVERRLAATATATSAETETDTSAGAVSETGQAPDHTDDAATTTTTEPPADTPAKRQRRRTAGRSRST